MSTTKAVHNTTGSYGRRDLTPVHRGKLARLWRTRRQSNPDAWRRLVHCYAVQPRMNP